MGQIRQCLKRVSEMRGSKFAVATLTLGKDSLRLKRILENMGTTKINDFHDALVADDNIVELEISVREANTVEISHAIENLQEAAANLLLRHSARHDNGKQIVWAVFHDLKPATFFLKNIQRFDDVAVVER